MDDRPEVAASPAEEPTDLQPKQNKVDLRGTLRVVRGVPGLLALIGFSCFNNFLAGAFMALMDAYGCISCQCRRGACCGVRSVRVSSSVGSPSPRLA